MGGVRVVGIVLILATLWNFFITFYGLAFFFDLPLQPKINPAQFTFGLVVTTVVLSFVITSHMIWNLKSEDMPALLLKGAWSICVAINLFAAWEGTKRFVFYGDDADLTRAVGAAVVTVLIVISTMLLSRLLLEKKASRSVLS